MDPNGVGDGEVLWFFSTAAWKVPLGCAFVRLSRVDQAGASPRPTKVVLFPFIHPVVAVCSCNCCWCWCDALCTMMRMRMRMRIRMMMPIVVVMIHWVGCIAYCVCISFFPPIVPIECNPSWPLARLGPAVLHFRHMNCKVFLWLSTTALALMHQLGLSVWRYTFA